MLPRCSHITRKRGVFYYRRRIPKTPNGEVVLSLRTRVFRVAECLADGLDQEFRKLIQGVTTDDKTDLPTILRTYLKQRLDLDMWRSHMLLARFFVTTSLLGAWRQMAHAGRPLLVRANR